MNTWMINGVFALFALLVSTGLFFFVGRDHFPQIDAGQMQLHVRAR